MHAIVYADHAKIDLLARDPWSLNKPIMNAPEIETTACDATMFDQRAIPK